MEMLDELRQEIDRRVNDAHVVVLVTAFERLLYDVTAAQNPCAYHKHFQVYRQFRTRLTGLLRNAWSYDLPPDSKIIMRIANINKALAEIRNARYDGVCRECPACRTRRKRWPTHATFLTYQPALLYG